MFGIVSFALYFYGNGCILHFMVSIISFLRVFCIFVETCFYLYYETVLGSTATCIIGRGKA